MGQEVGRLCHLDLAPTSLTRALHSSTDALQWHCPLGHPSLSTLKHQIPSLGHELSAHCEVCQLSKHHHVSFPSRVDRRVSKVPLYMGIYMKKFIWNNHLGLLLRGVSWTCL
jgi:hypothetical protein